MPRSDQIDLDIKQDIEYHKRSWRRQRIAWVVMAFVIVATLLGLFGPGLLGDSIAGVKGAPLWMEFNRFGRLQAESTTLRIHIEPGATSDQPLRLWLSRSYLERVHVMHVMPEPQSVEIAADRYVYVIGVQDLSKPTTITFDIEPGRVGLLRGQVGIEGGSPLDFSQFIYP
jgi:hypothetical protein